MKKFIISLLFIVFIAALCCLNVSNGAVAHAASDTLYNFGTEQNPLYLRNIVEDDKIIGVRFGGYYFGDSGIEVTVDIYSSPTMDLGFAIGSSSLSTEQLATRNALAELFGEVNAYINKIDSLVNTGYDGSVLNDDVMPVSDIYRYNSAAQGDKLEISRETYEMLLIAREMYQATDGAYNPAVYRLVDLWGFSSRIYSNGNFGEPYDRVVSSEEFWTNGYPLPDEKYVKAFSDPQFVDFSQNAVVLTEENGRYFVLKNVAAADVDGVKFDQWLDLGGIAKGYVVDGIKQMLVNSGFERYNVDAGGSSQGYGLNWQGDKTELMLADPFDPLSSLGYVPLLQVDVSDCSISVSGQNIRKYTVDGVEYSHILDGKIGAPAQTGIASVMVVIPDGAGEHWAARGDCLTTALTVLGRDGVVEFINGYLREHGIKIAALYETLDGRKQLLTNFDEKEIKGVSDSFDEFDWSLKQNDDGVYYYDGTSSDAYKTVLIVLGCLLGAVAVGLIVYHFLRGRKTTLFKVQSARKDKPFKFGDILVYMGVVMVIAVLFFVFVLDAEKTQMRAVTVIDSQTGETLFVYNFARDESFVNQNSEAGWTIQVTRTSDVLTVRFEKDFNGKIRFNELTVQCGSNASVKMTDSLCGFHQDCVRNFPAIDRSGGAIVCSPNRLKVVTE